MYIRSIVCVVDVYRASFKIVLYLCVHSLINAIIISTNITIIIMYTCLATFLTTTVFLFQYTKLIACMLFKIEIHEYIRQSQQQYKI